MVDEINGLERWHLCERSIHEKHCERSIDETTTKKKIKKQKAKVLR
jgi:hypothetical protein